MSTKWEVLINKDVSVIDENCLESHMFSDFVSAFVFACFTLDNIYPNREVVFEFDRVGAVDNSVSGQFVRYDGQMNPHNYVFGRISGIVEDE